MRGVAIIDTDSFAPTSRSKPLQTNHIAFVSELLSQYPDRMSDPAPDRAHGLPADAKAKLTLSLAPRGRHENGRAFRLLGPPCDYLTLHRARSVSRKLLERLVGPAGFEPATYGL